MLTKIILTVTNPYHTGTYIIPDVRMHILPKPNLVTFSDFTPIRLRFYERTSL